MIVNVHNLTHRYGSRTALKSINLQVAAGEIFGLLGPNGGGKSTLFRILSTMMSPSEGSVFVKGIDAVRRPAEVRRYLGVVFQSQSLDKKLTVAENLTSQGHLYGLRGAELRKRSEQAMERLRLTDRRCDLVQDLSGGLRRRVEIAKALLHEPAVLLMDEPTTGLDPGARWELWQYIKELRERNGTTVLLTTHILEEADRCDRLLLIHEGAHVAEGTPAELKARVGGDVIVLEASDTEATHDRILARFGVRPQILDGTLRLEIANGHRFITELVEAFPGAIQSIALHKPTLQDVFLDETGVSLDS